MCGQGLIAVNLRLYLRFPLSELLDLRFDTRSFYVRLFSFSPSLPMSFSFSSSLHFFVFFSLSFSFFSCYSSFPFIVVIPIVAVSFSLELIRSLQDG